MRNIKSDVRQKRIIERTIDSLAERNKFYVCGYIILILIYFAVLVATKVSARSHIVFKISDSVLPVSAFAGVLSALGNIIVIFLVVYYKKLGYITSLILLLAQFPTIVFDYTIRNSLASLPGIYICVNYRCDAI